jgi:hypothetical protein
VTNDSGLTAAAGGTVTFDGSAPVAVLNAPATAVAGQEVVLDAGGSSDPDAGDTLSFAWDTGFGVFQAPNAAVLRLVPTRVGDLAVRVRVMDSTGAFSVAATTISVTAPAVAAAAAVPAPVAKTSTLAHALAARFVSLRVTRAGTTLVVVECPKTSPGCRGRGTVAVGKRTRSLDYALASGKRKTLAIRSPVRLHGRRARAAKLRLADEAGLTVTRSFTLRKR